MGQFTPFDLLVVMLLSESVSNGLVGGDQSLLGGLMAAATLIALNMVVALVTSRSFRAQEWVEGRPVLMGRDGEIFQEVLKRHRIPMHDVERSLREADCDLKDMKVMFLEADGQISILQHSTGAGAGHGVHA